MAAPVAPQPGCGGGAGEPGLGGGDAGAGAGRRSVRWLCPCSSRAVGGGSERVGPAPRASRGLPRARGEPRRRDRRGRRLCLLLRCHGHGPSSVPMMLGTRSPNCPWASVVRGGDRSWKRPQGWACSPGAAQGEALRGHRDKGRLHAGGGASPDIQPAGPFAWDFGKAALRPPSLWRPVTASRSTRPPLAEGTSGGRESRDWLGWVSWEPGGTPAHLRGTREASVRFCI